LRVLDLSSHIPGLQMADLFHASACLDHDDAACRRLIRLVDDEIGPSLIRRFRQSITPGRCEQIVQDVLSQVWSSPRAARNRDADLSDSGGQAAGARRLERFFGTSTLKTWLYSIGFRMLQDETRSQRTRERPLETDATTFVPVAPESPPDEAAALRDLTSRFKPRLTTELEQALQALRQRPQPRLAQVAYLWLPCRVPQVEIADMFGVTKSSISQRVKEIIEGFLAATAGVIGELSAATGLDSNRLSDTLRQELPSFFVPVLEQQWLSELRRLQSARPQLVQVGYLQWREQASPAEIANQLGETPARVAVLVRQLDDWRCAAESRIAKSLNAESDVPVELLERAARLALVAGFARELPATEASFGQQP
ncbi:MAG: sigma-70 family RNA polymerase sigma factor, partial [Planctomycetaceae bacterium]|nr:sigma-70 family RNA polymerase sigma factor [Planctomycetaceae bacterium]